MRWFCFLQLFSVCHDTEVPLHAMSHIELMTQQRLNRMPLQYIVGEWDFHNVTVKLKAPVFIPRPETEVFYLFKLIDIVLYIFEGYVKSISLKISFLNIFVVYSNLPYICRILFCL